MFNTVGELIDNTKLELYRFCFRWQGERESRDLHEVLELFGYKYSEENEVKVGDYNNINCYLNCKIEKMEE